MKLTIVASNRDRLNLENPSGRLFLKSIQWQDYFDFELLVVDGGSRNFDELEKYFSSQPFLIPMRIIQHKIGEPFLRALLNNIGIRNANGVYIMTTDVDMVFAPPFVSTLVGLLAPDVIVESRTMYWWDSTAKALYESDKNQYNMEELRVGKIKKRTTAGGCQCMHKNSWSVIRGFDESYVGWGSEDYDLYTRACRSGLKPKWMGEDPDSIMLFHQPHAKSNEQIRKDLAYQEENKKRLMNIRSFTANPNGWGGINDSQKA